MAFSLALVFADLQPVRPLLSSTGSPRICRAIQPPRRSSGSCCLARGSFFVRSTFSAIGRVGVVLLVALFAAIVWWMVEPRLAHHRHRATMAWVVLTILAWCSASACRGRTSDSESRARLPSTASTPDMGTGTWGHSPFPFTGKGGCPLFRRVPFSAVSPFPPTVSARASSTSPSAPCTADSACGASKRKLRFMTGLMWLKVSKPYQPV